jgi:leucyl/phenylalanyl-tRNA--protein transferase
MPADDLDNWQEEIGLVAIGGDLTPRRVLAGYAQGIFPWPLLGEKGPVLWCSPDPRFVLFPEELHVSRSLRRTLRRRTFEVRYDTAFDRVVAECARSPRPGQRGTWITGEMRRVYVELHERGFAHSVESWREGELVGGLYGLALGGVFFGESMFARASEASKVAFVDLVERLRGWDFCVIDCQQRTAHLERFGAREVSRERFEGLVARGLSKTVGSEIWG